MRDSRKRYRFSENSLCPLLQQLKISVCMHHRRDFLKITLASKDDQEGKTPHRAEPDIAIYDPQPIPTI